MIFRKGKKLSDKVNLNTNMKKNEIIKNFKYFGVIFTVTGSFHITYKSFYC